VQHDALKFLASLDEACADLVFLDPPFNLGKLYSEQRRDLDSRPEQEYQSWLTSVLTQGTRVLKPGGALYLYHLPLWAMRLGSTLEQNPDLSFQHWIAIAMKNGFVRGDHLYPAHYSLLLFTKGKPANFQRPKLQPTRCRHCKELIKDYGGYLSIIEAKGINLSDFWEDLSPVRHANKKHRKANELPSKFFERIFGISGIKGGLYVDPFAGTGSGVLEAVRSGMRFEACDILAENCSIIRRRLDGKQ
jgi:site-specific DNA-methyltransferase (adenine-specific)